jgi:hypothetical protein
MSSASPYTPSGSTCARYVERGHVIPAVQLGGRDAAGFEAQQVRGLEVARAARGD